MGISGCCNWHAIRGPQRIGQGLRFHLCHVEIPWAAHRMFPYITLAPNLLSREEFALWRKGSVACPVSFPPHPQPWLWGRATFRIIVTSAACYWRPSDCLLALCFLFNPHSVPKNWIALSPFLRSGNWAFYKWANSLKDRWHGSYTAGMRTHVCLAPKPDA